MKLGVGGASLVQSDLAKEQLKPTSETINAVKAVEAPTTKKPSQRRAELYE